MTEKSVLIERRGAVAIVWLNRPEHRNAYTPEMAVRIQEALVECDADDDVRVIVVTGSGDHFGVGADFGIDWRDPQAHAVESLSEPEKAPWNLTTPIIAAINGDAIGVHLTWAMQADIRIVASDARIAFSFNRVGIMPDRNSMWLLPRLAGFGPAMDLLLTGRTIMGDRMMQWGLASESVPAAEVLPTALAFAEDIATYCAPASVTVTKRLMYEFLEEPDRIRAYNRERRTLNWIRTLGETLRGIDAITNKKKPAWGTSKHTRIPAELR
ncbi:enoyl-CoA hydratase/isomerase family protein [Microbacterium sp. NC79]|uniref:enoyl-CoA hydratase/isomerase family protein n=1 Tax=Microbacterium sp. NC79 TaxID=2851009 RepID=UPI001C2B96AD|nr:enoyl-CoA hydratase-related protein [Microbacterium sp. NC79]MBV0896134.1 enoyl-CoA hydratase/isomerase family protein [Microbacterium sp. NC79]